MIVITSQDPGPLSNSYVIGDRPGGCAVLLDGGTPMGPIVDGIDQNNWTPQRLFVTHRHPDHIANVASYSARYSIPVAGHAAEAQACGGFDEELEGGECFSCGELVLRVLHIPGHTAGHIALCVQHGDELAVFTGDTLFRGSVGGTLGQGHTHFEDLRRSLLEVLMTLPANTCVYPGHSIPSTIGEEREHNPFVRAWSAKSAPPPIVCAVAGRPAELLLRGPDYDGGTKCWVRWPESGDLDVVPGSRVVTNPGAAEA